MCRFIAYLGPPILLSELLLEPNNSLVRQSHASKLRKEPLNGDGFGVAWYAREVSSRPGRIRSISPAWSNHNLREVSAVTKSDCIFAHVRAASGGMRASEANCHPFVSGKYTFMHNGVVAEFPRHRRAWLEMLTEESFLATEGTTDTECLFGIFMDHVQRMEKPDADALAQALAATIETVVEKQAQLGASARLNLAVTDGENLAATRFALPEDSAESLYTLFTPGDLECKDGRLVLTHRTADPSLLVCSEPLTEDEAWTEVPTNHVVIYTRGREPRISPLATGT